MVSIVVGILHGSLKYIAFTEQVDTYCILLRDSMHEHFGEKFEIRRNVWFVAS